MRESSTLRVWTHSGIWCSADARRMRRGRRGCRSSSIRSGQWGREDRAFNPRATDGLRLAWPGGRRSRARSPVGADVRYSGSLKSSVPGSSPGLAIRGDCRLRGGCERQAGTAPGDRNGRGPGVRQRAIGSRLTPASVERQRRCRRFEFKAATSPNDLPGALLVHSACEPATPHGDLTDVIVDALPRTAGASLASFDEAIATARSATTAMASAHEPAPI